MSLAEMNVIACLFCRPDAISLTDHLKPEMFTDELLGRMYREFLVAYDRNTDMNAALLQERLKCQNIEPAVFTKKVTEIMSMSYTSVNIKTYADAVVDAYKAHMLNKYLSSIRITSSNYYDVVQGIEQEIERLHGERKSKAKNLATIANECADKYFCANDTPRIDLGFARLDDMLGGLEGGDMIVIGARPGVGKSALVTQITSNLSKIGKKIGFFNLEMLEKQMFERFVVSESGIGLTRLKRAVAFCGDEKERYFKAVDTLKKAENIVISTGRKSMSDIRHESRHQNFDVIIIDYLQLIKSDSKYRGNRTAEVGDISKSIKELAMDLGIPIIALSQMNRVSEMRDDKEPSMSELREAGDIEQDASVIILLWDTDKDDHSKKGCKIEKQRQGKTGKVFMRFNGDLMRFEETDGKENKRNSWETAPPDTPFI